MVVKKMKDKCKDAARMRREKERAEFVELSRLLPLPTSTTSQLDKASIIRLTSSYLRMRSAFPEGLGESWGQHKRANDSTRRHDQQQQTKAPLFVTRQNINHQIKELGSLILQTLDGFVFAMHRDGKIMYISETASVHLGLPQIDLTGSSVFDYVHPADRDDIKHTFSLSEAEVAQLNSSNVNGSLDSNCNNGLQLELSRSFCMRMKCILPKRNAGLVSSGYKAIHCHGYLKVRCNQEQDKTRREWESYALVAVGHSLLPTASTEVKLTNNSFMFRASLDFKLYHVESIMTDLLGFEQFDVIGHSLYQFVHVNDIQHLEQSHKLLLDKGQVVSRYYRLMKRNGGFIWIQSHATLVNNQRNTPKPQHIVSVCTVLGDDLYDLSRFLHDNPCESSMGIVNKSPISLDSPSAKSSSGEPKQSSLSVGKRENKLCQIEKTTTKNAKQVRTGGSAKSKLARVASQMLLVDQQIRSAQNNKRARPVDDRTAPMKGKEHLLATFDNYDHYSSHLMSSYDNLSKAEEAFEPVNGEFCANRSNLLPSGSAVGFSIGSTRRASDDSCSIVSSVASTSVSSRSSTHQLIEPESYLLAGGYHSLADSCLANDHHHQQQQQHHNHIQQHTSQTFPVATHQGLEENVIGLSCATSINDCHSKVPFLAEQTNQQIRPNNPIWPRAANEFSANMDMVDNSCQQTYQVATDNQEQFGMQQFVQINSTSQPWMNQVQMCSSSFSASIAPLNHLSPDYHQEQQQHHNNNNHQHHQHQSANEIYIETHQPYNSYTNHSTMIHFHPSPPTNLSSV